MDSLQYLVRQLDIHPKLLSKLSLMTIHNFIRLCASLRNDILLVQRADHNPVTPPLFLPPTIQQFLAQSLDIPLETVADCWTVLKALCWDDTYTSRLSISTEDVFRKHGVDKGLSAYSQLSP